jgi:hypothetical protein
MMIAAGNLPEKFLVAESNRRPLEEFYTIISTIKSEVKK